MKKHELLEKAMRDYPAGTLCRFDSAPHVDHVSNGKFHIFNDGINLHVCGGDGGDCFYSKGEWAEIITTQPEPLRIEKIAVKVSNEREFKVLMGHYEEMGWKPIPISADKKDFGSTHHIFEYSNPYQRIDESNIIATNQYKIIDFDFFCAQKGIDNPKPILKTEDGVDLYEGDKYWKAHKDIIDSHWFLLVDYPISISDKSDCIASPNEHKAFSTKEAAEKWIEEQNKPKKVKINLYNKNSKAIIEAGEITVCCESFGIKITPSDLEDMLNALKSLQ